MHPVVYVLSTHEIFKMLYETELGKTVYIWLWIKATGILYCCSYWVVTCLKLHRPPWILPINIKFPLRNDIKEGFWCNCYNAYITSTNDYANVFYNNNNNSNSPSFNKNKYSFWLYLLYTCKSFQVSTLYQYTKRLDIIFFAITNTGWQQSFDCITLERERDFHSQNFIKKNIIFNVVVSLLATNQIEPVCISVAQRKVHLLPIILDNI